MKDCLQGALAHRSARRIGTGRRTPFRVRQIEPSQKRRGRNDICKTPCLDETQSLAHGGNAASSAHSMRFTFPNLDKEFSTSRVKKENCLWLSNRV